MKAFLYIVVLIAFVSVVYVGYERVQKQVTKIPDENEPVACTLDAMICPDGTTVGRTGPNCEFVCPVPAVDPHSPEAKADLIRLTTPQPEGVITSPLTITGVARGYWYFEATFPIILTDWDGLIIAEGYATADSDWMTEEFVPFTATLEFEKPAYGDRGSLILQKSNASGLPEHDDALEITVFFNEPATTTPAE